MTTRAAADPSLRIGLGLAAVVLPGLLWLGGSAALLTVSAAALLSAHLPGPSLRLSTAWRIGIAACLLAEAARALGGPPWIAALGAPLVALPGGPLALTLGAIGLALLVLAPGPLEPWTLGVGGGGLRWIAPSLAIGWMVGRLEVTPRPPHRAAAWVVTGLWLVGVGLGRRAEAGSAEVDGLGWTDPWLAPLCLAAVPALSLAPTLSVGARQVGLLALATLLVSAAGPAAPAWALLVVLPLSWAREIAVTDAPRGRALAVVLVVLAALSAPPLPTHPGQAALLGIMAAGLLIGADPWWWRSSRGTT